MPTSWAVAGPFDALGETPQPGYQGWLGTGESFSWTPPVGGAYYVSVNVGYQETLPLTDPRQDCSGGGSSSNYPFRDIAIPMFEPPVITGMVLFGPAIVDKVAQVVVQSTFPRSPLSENWDFGDKTSCTNCFGDHTWTAPGTYLVHVDAINPAGKTSRDLQVVVAPDPPTITFLDYGPAGVIPTAGTPLQFTTSVGGSTRDRSFLWDFGDGTTSTDPNPLHTFPVPDFYNVLFTVTNKWGTATATERVVVSPAKGGSPPTTPAGFVYSPPVPVTGQEVTFQATATGRVTRWRWKFDDGTPPVYTQNATHTFTQAARRNVELSAANEFGEIIIVHFVDIFKGDIPPVAHFSFTPLRATVGQPVQFTDESAGAATWSWNFGDGGTSTLRNPTHVFTSAGVREVTLSVTNAFGSDSVTIQLPCDNAVSDLSADFTITPAQPVQNKATVFQDTSTGNPTSWNWTFSDGFSATGPSLTRVFTNPGRYTADLTISRADGQTGFREKGFDLLVKPVASFKVVNAPVVGQPIGFTDTSQGAPTKWTWSLDGFVVSTANSFAHTFVVPGKVSVTLKVENDAGEDSATQVIDVTQQTVPLITSLTGGYGDCFFQGLSVKIPYQANVLWRGLDPAVLDVTINDTHTLVPADAGGAAFTVDGSLLKKGLGVTDNPVTVIAIATNQAASDPVTQHIWAFAIFAGPQTKLQFQAQSASLVTSIGIPLTPWEAITNVPEQVPVFGGYPFGFTAFQIKFDETYKSDCTYSGKLSGGGGVTAAGVTAVLSVNGTVARSVSKEGGVGPGKASVGVLAAISVATKPIPIVTFIPLMVTPCKIPGISQVCSVLTVTATAGGEFGGDLNFTIDAAGDVTWKDATLTGKLLAELKATAEVKPAKIEVFGGGSFGMTASLTSGFQSASASLEFGARASLYIVKVEAKESVTCTITPAGANCGGAFAKSPEPYGVITLLHVPPLAKDEAVEVLASGDPVILKNLGSLAASATAARDDRTLVAYLGENAAANGSPQRLDLRYVTRQGSNTWSSPKSITNDLTGDFDPALVFSSTGRGIVAWERLRSSTLTNNDIQSASDLPKLFREIEIATATWNASSDSWSAPQVLTSNDLYDHSPSLAALDDGRVMLVWIREAADGSSDQQVVARLLQGDVWGAEQVIASVLRGAGALSMVSRSNDVQLVFSGDKDGDLTTASDREISHIVFHANTWGTLHDITNDTSADSSPTVAYDNDGAARMAWLRDGNIATKRLPDGAIEVVRDNTTDGSVANPVLSVTPAGIDLVTWLDRGDVFERVRDAQSGKWSSDIRLTQTPEQEGRLDVYFASDGAMHMTGLRTIDVATTPVVDLVDVDHLRVDVAAVAGSMSSSTTKPTSGQTITLSADVRNNGDLPVRDVRVVLVRGQAATDTPVNTTSVAGEWLPGETRHLSLTSTYDPAKPLYTIAIDPNGTIGDADKSNNQVSFSFAYRWRAARPTASPVPRP